MIRFFGVLLFSALIVLPVQATEPNSQYRDAVQFMYIAYYGRPGDHAGITYWAEVLQQNKGNLSAIIDAFGNSVEYRERFSGLGNQALVNHIYLRLFNRSAETDGLNWYVEKLEAGEMTLASIALNIAAGASAENDDGLTVVNRLDLANKFTDAVRRFHLGYTNSEIVYAKQLLDLVTSDVATIALAEASFPDTLDQFPRLANVVIRFTTNFGTISVEMFHRSAPYTTDNFLNYVDTGFYNNTLIHRVESDFLIQGGGFNLEGVLKETNDSIINEAANGLSNLRGTIAMARFSDPDSAASQFFINLSDNTGLDYSGSNAGYAVFGQVVDGMAVVDAIAQVATTTRGSFTGVPVEKVIVYTASRIEGAE